MPARAAIHLSRSGAQDRLSAETLRDFAQAMAPRLLARAQEAEALRRLPEETVREAEAAGFFGVLTPRCWGGGGVDFAAFLDAVRELATGCTSSAWTLSFLALHSWLLCKFSPELQAELFAEHPWALAPAPLAPTGKAVPAAGGDGFRVSGRWEWATGVMHADWVMLSCLEPDSPDPRFCVAPIGAVRVDDVWRTAGMAATGSNVIVAEDVFVPAHRTAKASALRGADAPGLKLHPASTVGYPLSATLALVAATPALGAAEGALAAFTARAKEKLMAYSGTKQADTPATHLRLGEAMAAVKAARLVWQAAIAELQALGDAGAPFATTQLASIRLAAADVVRLANVAINTLCASAGASAGFLSSPLQRQLRDVQMMRGHVIFDWDRAAQIGGRIALGLEPTPADLL